jgi:hypothetical protein
MPLFIRDNSGFAAKLFRYLALLGGLFTLPADVGAESQQPAEATGSIRTLPPRAARFRPWSAEQIYRLTVQEVKPVVSPTGAGGRADAAAGFWKPWFDGAILFVTERDQRLVTIGNQPPGTSVDYVEIRQTGNGFGVNTDNYSSKSHLYLDHFRLMRPAPGSSGQARVEFLATINYTGATKKPNDAARLVFTALPWDEGRGSATETGSPADASLAQRGVADPPTTVTVTDASPTQTVRRSPRRLRR